MPETRNGKLVLDPNGRPKTQPLMASASAEAEGDWSFGGAPIPSQCEDNGGGVEPQPKDCGVPLELHRHRAGVRAAKQALGRRQRTHGWDFAARPNDYSGHNLPLAFENCPFWSAARACSA